MSSRSILHDQRLNHTTHVNNISVLQKVQEKKQGQKNKNKKTIVILQHSSKYFHNQQPFVSMLNTITL